MADAPPQESRRVLDPIERSSEVIFGVIMALTFTGAISTTSPEREDVRELLVGALGCNTAWGIVDAVMYVITRLIERGRGLALLHRLQRTPDGDADAARAIIGEVLPPLVARELPAEGYAGLRARLLAVRDVPARPRVTGEDLRGAVEIFLLVFVSTLPLAVPFMLMDDVRRALRASNAVALAMMFLAGWVLGRYAGWRPARTGLVLAALGAVLVGITIALGG